MGIKKYPNCNGCSNLFNSRLGKGNRCDLAKINTNGDCPCTHCLVKMVCDSPCKDFYIFRGGYILESLKYRRKLESS